MSDGPIENVAGWTEVPLKSITVKIGSGATPRGGAQSYLESRVEYALVRSQNVFDNRFDSTGLAFIKDAQAHALRGVSLKPNDILLNITGDGVTFGRACMIPTTELPACVNQHVSIVRVDPSKASPHFVLGYLTHPRTKKYIESFNSGGSRRAITKRHIESFMLPLPGLEEQKRIASVLGAFDALIEANVGMSRLVDDMWRAVVRSTLSGCSEMVTLSSLAEFVNGRNFTRDASGTGMPVIRTPEVRTGPSNATIRNEVTTTSDRIARAGDILFVWSGSLLVSRWHWEPGLINQHVFKVLPAPGVPDWLVMFAIEELMDDFLGVAADKATTMGHIKRSDLDRKVAIPPRSMWHALDDKIGPLWDEALAARMHVADLTRSRDVLLPLLMSGKVRVDESLEVA